MAEDSSNNGIVKIGNNAIMRYSNALVRRAIQDLSSETKIYINPILIVEDEETLCELMKQVLTNAGYNNITIAYDGSTAIQVVQKRKFKLVLLNVGIPEPNGIKVLQYIKEHVPSTKVVLTSGYNSDQVAARAIRLGANAFLRKPLEPGKLLSTVKSIMKQYE
jgi:DNA-binding NtrC family response regulator